MKQRNKVIKYGLGASLATMAGNAMAALPAGVSDAFTTGTADGTSLAWMWVAFGVTVGIIYKLVRR